MIKDFSPRKPYIDESARDYYYNVIVPFFKGAKIGFTDNEPRKDGFCGSYTCYHWFQGEKDTREALIVERPARRTVVINDK